MNITEARILVVEDDAVMCTYVVNALGRLGIAAIQTATDGASALKKMDQFQPDLVITDIHMQPVGGLEVVQAMRKHGSVARREMPVIFMSADSSLGTLQNALPLGSSGFIVKPPSLETLRAKIELALN